MTECDACGCDTDHERQETALEVAKVICNDLQKQNDKLREAIKQAEQRGYAKGKADGNEEVMKTCDECSRVQYEKGQADILQRLKSARKASTGYNGLDYRIQKIIEWALESALTKVESPLLKEPSTTTNIPERRITSNLKNQEEKCNIVNKPEKPSGAICGGRHHFKTKAEAVKHAHKDYEACIDCWAGTPWTIDNPKPKRKVKRCLPCHNAKPAVIS